MSKHYRDKLAPIHIWGCAGIPDLVRTYTRGEARAFFKERGKGMLDLSTVHKVKTQQPVRRDEAQVVPDAPHLPRAEIEAA